MNLGQMINGMMAIQQLGRMEIQSRALRELSLSRLPWYQRPYFRIKTALAFRRSWKTELANMKKELAEFEKRQAQPKPPAQDGVIDLFGPDAN